MVLYCKGQATYFLLQFINTSYSAVSFAQLSAFRFATCFARSATEIGGWSIIAARGEGETLSALVRFMGWIVQGSRNNDLKCVKIGSNWETEARALARRSSMYLESGKRVCEVQQDRKVQRFFRRPFAVPSCLVVSSFCETNSQFQ